MERDQALAGTVALLALSGYEPDTGRLARATRYFEKHGYRVVAAPEPGLRSTRFSASDDLRLVALDDVLGIGDLRIVIGLRGGYGLSRIVDRIDFQAIARSVTERQVRWVGHSDWTALHLALLRTTGAVSYAGPLAAADFGGEAIDPFTEHHFWHAMRGDRLDFSWSSAGGEICCEGPLWGGNLAMLSSLVGTPYLPAPEGGILFLEDVNEHPYRVERMLVQLALAGILERQKVVLMGDFSAYRLTDYDQGYDLPEAISYLRSRSGVPFITGLPFGHGAAKLTLPLGQKVRLERTQGSVRLSECARP